MVFVCFVLATAVFSYWRLRHVPLSPHTVRATVLSWGAFAPLIYIAIVALRPFIFFPSALLFMAAGLAFGPLLGTLYASIGGTAAAVVSFLVARSLGREFIQARLPRRLHYLQEHEWGVRLIFFLNLMPVMPMTAVNYGAGLSRVSLYHYTIAVIGGLTPRAFAYTFFGDSLLEVGSAQFITAITILCLLVVAPAVIRWMWFTRWRQPSRS